MGDEPWQTDEIWMDEQVCDFCKKEQTDNECVWFTESINKLQYTGDQPAVYVCGQCVINGTIEWYRKVDDIREDKDEYIQALQEIYCRGLDIKVFAGKREYSEITLGDMPDN